MRFEKTDKNVNTLRVLTPHLNDTVMEVVYFLLFMLNCIF